MAKDEGPGAVYVGVASKHQEYGDEDGRSSYDSDVIQSFYKEPGAGPFTAIVAVEIELYDFIADNVNGVPTLEALRTPIPISVNGDDLPELQGNEIVALRDALTAAIAKADEVLSARATAKVTQ